MKHSIRLWRKVFAKLLATGPQNLFRSHHFLPSRFFGLVSKRRKECAEKTRCEVRLWPGADDKSCDPKINPNLRPVISRSHDNIANSLSGLRTKLSGSRSHSLDILSPRSHKYQIDCDSNFDFLQLCVARGDEVDLENLDLFASCWYFSDELVGMPRRVVRWLDWLSKLSHLKSSFRRVLYLLLRLGEVFRFSLHFILFLSFHIF